ncbi:MAG: type 2 isopentenyl-diphosphate Delta-isomerase [Candidatus Thermoplasmatota archaeon]|nr:type 2 isopentenyl-diphosphate Delta-isomerase [Candidatus Thermoplasmatota archaeon]
MNEIESRKDEHVRLALEKNVSASFNYWDNISLVHNALPEINKSEVDLSVESLGKKLDAPLLISGMTGGYSKAKKINENLATAAEKYQLAMGVGSQRAGLNTHRLKDTYSVVKDFDIPLRIGNIGASQLVLWGHDKTVSFVSEMAEMIDADAIAICLNFLQEVIQFEGEAHAKGTIRAIQKLAEAIDIPIIVKESGAGISYEVAEQLSNTKIASIDIGGMGGTSFAAIEHYRAKMHFDRLHARGGKTFWDWGIPTPQSLVEVRDAVDEDFPVIASGGIRHGLDAAKALALGADLVGMANALLKPASKSEKETLFEIDAVIKELRAAMFLTGCDHVDSLQFVEVNGWI